MGIKLYVGSLPYTTTVEELKTLFGECGSVQTATIITDRVTGQSKGFGFVEMSTSEEAQQAIQKLNGKPMGGRSIIVNEARPPEKRGFGGGGGGGRGGRGGGGGRW